jgi:N-acetyl-alpha-D-muramate 1-phosphate uridylyltransferase
LEAVILAGGLGTRLRPVTEEIPKAMVPVNGRPFLEYEVDLLRREGVDDLVVCIGHLGGAIKDHFGNGKNFGVRIRYSDDGPRLLGPAGALKRAEPLLSGSYFVTYGDAYLRAPYAAMMKRLHSSGRLALMAAYRNNGKHGRSDLRVRGGMVVRYDKNGGAGMSWINYGVTAMRKRALESIPAGREVGEESFYGGLIERGELIAFPVRRRFYEIGTPASLEEFARYIRTRQRTRS